MAVDKDKPWTWRKFQKGMCQGCLALCCAMPVEVTFDDIVGLGLATEDQRNGSMKKLAKALIKKGLIKSYREITGLFMLESKPNGDCVFLKSETRLCTVYDRRPQVCRKFPEVGPKPGSCPAVKA